MYMPFRTPKKIPRKPGCAVMITWITFFLCYGQLLSQLYRNVIWVFFHYFQCRHWNICTIRDFHHYNLIDILFAFSSLLIYIKGYCAFRFLDYKHLYFVYIKWYYSFCTYLFITLKSIMLFPLLNYQHCFMLSKKKNSLPEFTLDFTASHGFGHWQDQAILEE